jgi:hypothetical protein
METLIAQLYRGDSHQCLAASREQFALIEPKTKTVAQRARNHPQSASAEQTTKWHLQRASMRAVLLPPRRAIKAIKSRLPHTSPNTQRAIYDFEFLQVHLADIIAKYNTG